MNQAKKFIKAEERLGNKEQEFEIMVDYELNYLFDINRKPTNINQKENQELTTLLLTCLELEKKF